jgi:hypothetical protein
MPHSSLLVVVAVPGEPVSIATIGGSVTHSTGREVLQIFVVYQPSTRQLCGLATPSSSSLGLACLGDAYEKGLEWFRMA